MVDDGHKSQRNPIGSQAHKFEIQLGFSAKTSGELPVWILRIPWYGGGFAAGLSLAGTLGWLI
jgi:hypothetical protein